MKKMLIVCLLALPIIATAEEIVTLNSTIEPQWEDFAPANFLNVSAPKGLGKLNETAVYWYNRRVDFEKAISECKDLQDEQDLYACYQKVKIKQFQENSAYNARIEAMEQARSGPQEMFDRTDIMLPIGNYFNNFTRFQPNEFR